MHKRIAPNFYMLTIFSLCFLLLFQACTSTTGNDKLSQKDRDSIAIRQAWSASPVLTPAESMKKMTLEDGFTIQLVAAEPLVTAPVAMIFDDKARIWVIEMDGYMPDTLGTGEDKPVSKISILYDTNNDGVMDSRKVFLDGLVLPRALCLVENGLLYAEPPNLFYVPITNDAPGTPVLIDSTYAAGGNVEHQANGLYRGLDNWIYSANSTTRYRKAGDKWLKERTHGRGQWGISQDNFGRLFYNNNSQNALGDYFPPGLGAANPNQKDVAGYDVKVVPSNRVYPARATTGVNRGYQPKVLDDSLRLVNFTAASGPVVYRGDLFGEAYQQNLFVGEPSANLVKRNILAEKSEKIEGKQAYEGREFIASTDERFRPVTLYNGPDGALYLIDMYRGIIQHKTYLTEYLKNEIKSRELEKPLNCGRIYRVLPKNTTAQRRIIPANPDSLVQLLQHPNGWLRDKAQQMLVDGKYTQVVPALQQNLLSTEPLTVVHSMWTLEGLNALSPQLLIPLLRHSDPHVQVQALYAAASVANASTLPAYLPSIDSLAQANKEELAPYLALVVAKIQPLNPVATKRIALQLVKQFPKNEYVADAIISAQKGQEAKFLAEFTSTNKDTTLALYKQLNRTLTNIKNAANTASFKDYPKGARIFRSVCQTCHGADGNGIKSLAPPLNKSEWVTGNSDKLLAIILYGLNGPVKVAGKMYKAPEIAGEMPGIGNNTDYKDEDISELVNLIRNSWSNKTSKISVDDVKKVRQQFPGRQRSFTVEELQTIPGGK